MKLTTIIQKTEEAFRVALEKSEANIEELWAKKFPAAYILDDVQPHHDEMVEAQRLLQGLLAAELRRRNISREVDPFNPNTHHTFEYVQPTGPQGQRFSFVRGTDSTTTHPIGTRGWYHTKEACVAAMWEDHDELMASRMG